MDSLAQHERDDTERHSEPVLAAPSHGLCFCGCGGLAPIAKDTNRSRGNVKGQPQKYILHHMARMPVVKRYRSVTKDGIRKRLHVIRAERALGKPLPPGAVVHHADGTTSDSSPLVICQDTAYHGLLHIRMRIKAAGGNPNLDSICGKCKQLKKRTEFARSVRGRNGLASRCRSCKHEYDIGPRQQHRIARRAQRLQNIIEVIQP